MATPTQSIVWIIEGYEREPFMMVREYHPYLGRIDCVAEFLNYGRLQRFKAAGFVIDDPQGLVTCPACGEFKHWLFTECPACAGEQRDYQDDRQMYAELRNGG